MMIIQRYVMLPSRAAGGRAESDRGFTALEIAAVAAIIALMSLILIPIMRNRVEDAKIAAAKDDLAQIEKAETLAFGYTGHYFRLEDLTRPQANVNDPELTTVQQRLLELAKVPIAYWNQPAPATQQMGLVEDWKGPYLAIHKSASIQSLLDMAVHFNKFRSPNNSVPGTSSGPLMILSDDRKDWVSQTDNRGMERALYPLDPWGNPYLFFGSGRMGQAGGPNAVINSGLQETNYSTAAAYSLGPDGLPGNGRPDLPVNYYREAGYLGESGSDDLGREF